MATVSAINSLGERAYNPRGNLWFKDESTYGHKLLMKMGWSKGKGLGKNEDGIKENLSVKLRNTNSGLGYKDDLYANVMKTEYESILKNLNDCYSQNEASATQKENKCKMKSEQKSRIVGSKLRYPKLFYGKDVSKYSEKDMKSIFICSQQCKDNQENPEDKILQKSEPESELPKEIKTDSSTLSISDYFAKKMKERKRNPTNKAFNVPEQQQVLDSEISRKDYFSTISGNQPKMNGIHLGKNENKVSINSSDLQQIETELEAFETSENLALSTNKPPSSKKKKKSDINKIESNNVSIKTVFNDLDQQKSSLDPEITKTDFLLSISNKKMKKNRINSEINLKDESITNFYLQKNGKELGVARMEVNKSEISKADISSHTSECTVSNRKKRKLSEGLNCVDNVSDTCRKKRKSEMSKNENCSVDLDVNLVAHNKNETKIPCQINLSHVGLHQSKKLKKCHKERHMGTDEGKISQITIEDPSLRLVEEENVICLKKKKNKKVNLKKLKSCLKSKNGSYSLKNVSFNKVVSYKIIDNCFETVNCQPVASSSVQSNSTNEVVGTVDKSKTELNVKNKVVDILNKDKVHSSGNNEIVNVANEVKTKSGDNTHISKEKSSDVNKSCNDPPVEIAKEVSDKELKESCSLFSLPSEKSPYFNSWVESQSQALKMYLYKRMLKKMKNHEVLKTTNLLSIKGYGNWGFKSESGIKNVFL